MALSQNVPSVLFITAGATSSCYIFYKHVNPNSQFPFLEIYVKDYEKAKYEHSAKVNAHGMKLAERIISCIRQSHKVVLVKSCNEIEGKYIENLSNLCEKTILPVGLLVSKTIDCEEVDHAKIFERLGKTDKASTLFVSFGSECFLPKEEMEEMASGLEV